MSVRLGYACISTVLQEQGIYTNRTLTLKSLETKGVAEAMRLAKLNIGDLMKIIQYNEDNGIRFFRLTSNLFPHAENPRAVDQYDLEFARTDLKLAGELARNYGHRITMHPGQYVQLGSPRKEVVEQSFKDLTLHAKIFQYMGLTPEMGSVMIIHGGGTFGDKESTLLRWEENFKKLPENVRRYIALENDDYQYTTKDLLPICERNNIPLCIDFFHHECLGKEQFNIFEPALIQKVMNTWKLRGIKPKCHWSNQAPDSRKGTHGDYIDEIPAEIVNIVKSHGADVMCECKAKDLCVFRLLEKHFIKNISNGRVLWTIK